MKFDDNSLYNIKSSVDGKRYSLFELATWKNGLAFKKINFSETGVPVIKIAELNNGIGGTTAYTQQTFSEDVHLCKGDLLFSWSGNPQTSIDVFRFNIDEGWLNQHIFKVTPDEKTVDRDYFYFLMKNLKPHFTQIAINKQTTGLGHVTIADIKRMSVVIPSLDVQREIVSYIKPIDDKIELNNEINNNLIDYLTPIENVRLVNKNASETILFELGLDKSQINRNVMKLSGGQQQRVAIARALVSDSPIILADEPTGNLDADTAGEIIEILKKLAKERNKCVIVVTHSKEVANSADIVLELRDRKLKSINKITQEAK